MIPNTNRHTNFTPLQDDPNRRRSSNSPDAPRARSPRSPNRMQADGRASTWQVESAERRGSRESNSHSSLYPRQSRGSLTPAEVHLLSKARSNSTTPRRLSTNEKESSDGALLEEDGDEAVEDFEIGLYSEPVPTTKTLQEFSKVIERKIDPLVQLRKDDRLKRSVAEKERHKVTMAKLRKWADWKSEADGLRGFISTYIKHGPQPSLPNHENTISLAKYYYPNRGDLAVYVCDFGEGRFEKKEITLGDIDDYMYDKPAWSTVRWIHCPLNIGLVHSSVEDRFLKGARDDAKSHSGNKSWPYAQVETLSLRNRETLENMRDIRTYVKYHKELTGVKNELDSAALKGLSKGLTDDLVWRAGFLHRDLDYWELVTPDFQRQLSSGQGVHVDPLVSQLAVLNVEEQGISKLNFYKRAQIVRYPFRCFHRSDGFLLTMAAAGGIDYLDMAFNKYLDIPRDAFLDNEDGSVLGLMFELFSKTGTSTWHRKSVDWFLVYLLTEVAAKPNNIRQGCSAPSLARAYQSVIQNLKDKRYQEFKPKESINLVRDYLSCIDELECISSVLIGTMNMLKNLEANVEEMERMGGPDNPDGESARSRVEWAMSTVKDAADHYESTLVDMRQSLNALFQLRSIEQNERSIVADTQNEAILLFTGVTTVFLPLSFFTGYYGMNLKGVIDTRKTESYFWKVCGSVAFVIVFAVTLLAFRHSLKRRVMARVKAEEHMA